MIWKKTDGLFLIEIDRVLKPGGYFILTSPTTRQQQDSSTRASMSTPLEEFTKKLCWFLLGQQEETFIWQKTVNSQCYRCEPFPTYPRTYDLLHANGLLSHITSQECIMLELLLEMDRILRPEGWVIFSDKLVPIEKARMLATQIRWEARVIALQNGSDQRLLVCQKPFTRK